MARFLPRYEMRAGVGLSSIAALAERSLPWPMKWAALWVAVFLSACTGGDSPSAQLRFEVAAPSNGAQCESSIMGDPCTAIRVLQEVDGRFEPQPLFRPDDDHMGEGALTLRFDDRAIAFDVAESDADRTLEVQVFGSDLMPIAGASVVCVDLDPSSSTRVRLYPYSEWACPGGGALPRAFHQAIELDGGQILFLGGVQGEGVDPASALARTRTGAILQPIAQVYDPAEHRFVSLAGEFGRALFGAQYLGSDGAVHRVRVFGGVEGPSTVLRLDNTGTLASDFFGAPVVPDESASLSGQAIVRVDLDAMTLEVESEETDILPGIWHADSAFGAVGETADRRTFVVGLQQESDTFVPGKDAVIFARQGEQVVSHELLRPRLGGSISATNFGFLLFGGDLGEGAAQTAEWVLPTREPVAVDDAGLLPTRAFHAAATIDYMDSDAAVLIAGGLAIESDRSVLRQAAAPSLGILTLSADFSVETHSLDVGDYTPAMLQTASARAGGVWLIGGAVIGEAGNRLSPTAQAGRVDEGGYHAAASLSFARFGHTTTVLEGDRLLVVGGFGNDAASETPFALRALGEAEVLYDRAAPDPLMEGGCAP